MNLFGLKPADILLPQGDFARWSVVACDQYTSEPAYWQEVERIVGDAPSALRVTLPEIYLNDRPAERIAAINATMEQYIREEVLRCYPDSMVYIERHSSAGVRRGLLGVIDLTEYEYEKQSHAPIRATEQTVVERIPPRVAIRRDAPLELPHVLLLADDPARTLIEPLSKQVDRFQKVYDFDLMMGGGHITGWLLDDAAKAQVQAAEAALTAGQAEPLLFAVGDGNHSLATAKECYRQNPTPQNRYALAEVVNIHDDAIQFEPIYRVVFHVDDEALLGELARTLGCADGHRVTCVTAAGEQTMMLRATAKLPVGTLQAFLDEYVAAHPEAEVDYIHGEESLRALCRTENTVGFLFNGMGKDELFPAIAADGSLPRKTFSMGHAEDKRYYLESRKIR